MPPNDGKDDLREIRKRRAFAQRLAERMQAMDGERLRPEVYHEAAWMYLLASSAEYDIAEDFEVNYKDDN